MVVVNCMGFDFSSRGGSSNVLVLLTFIREIRSYIVFEKKCNE